MANPTLYKKKALNDVRNRTTVALSSSEKTRVNTVVQRFIDLFKNKHLG